MLSAIHYKPTQAASCDSCASVTLEAPVEVVLANGVGRVLFTATRKHDWQLHVEAAPTAANIMTTEVLLHACAHTLKLESHICLSTV